MAPQPPQAVLLDDGELDDVRALLREIGVAYCNARDARRGARVPLLLSTPAAARALAAGTLDAPLHQLHVVVCGDTSERAPCDFVLRRPIDPAVLRLLTRRAGYEGAERRRVGRVVLGIPVKLRVDGDEREAVLTEISIAGCGLVSPVALRTGARIELQVPPDLTAPRNLALVGRILATREHPTADRLTFDVSVSFDDLDLVDRVTLRALMAGQALDLRPRVAKDPGRPKAGCHRRAVPGEGDRRRLARRRFRRHVMGAQDGRAHLLIGRDLSIAGMRIERGEEFREGDRLKVALYAGADAAPILLEAEVRRDDGADGYFLSFGELEPTRTEKLLCLLETLAPIELDDPLGRPRRPIPSG